MEQNKVQQFLNDNFGEVRVLKKDDELWFVAKDICSVLGTQTRDVKKILDEDEVDSIHITDTTGREQEMLCISESGLYTQVIKSRKPFAKDFKKWITGTVIPAIRKDGGYISGEEEVIKDQLSEEEFVLKAMQILQSKVVRITEERDKLKQENIEMKPKVENWRRFIGSDGTYSFTECAKLVSTIAESEQSDISISVFKLTELLRNEGILNKSKTPDKEGKKGSYKNLPNKDYESMFDVISVGTNGGFNKTQTKVKPDGVEFIYELLKKKHSQEA